MPSASACGKQSPFIRCVNDEVQRLGSTSERTTILGLVRDRAMTAASIGAKSQGGSSEPGLALLQASQMLFSAWLLNVQFGQVQVSVESAID